MTTEYKVGDMVLQNWNIEKRIGEGSFGKVYQIGRDDFGTHYSAALKVMSVPQSEAERRSIIEEGLSNQNVTQYFYTMVEEIVKEFALMSQFKGTANIVSYEDHQVVPHENGEGWDILIRMELLTPLQTHLAHHSLTLAEVSRLAIDLCKALELCQKYNVIHRDIKPENIFISSNGDYKLGDFGIARTIERTASGLSKKGTYSYMAPEVYRGLEYGFTVDTYSLGLVLYRLLNQNRLPFMPLPPAPLSYSDREKALSARISGNPLPLPLDGRGGLAEIVCKACGYEPSQRFATASALRVAIEALGNPLAVTPTSPPQNQPLYQGFSSNPSAFTVAKEATVHEPTEHTAGMFQRGAMEHEPTEHTTGMFQRGATVHEPTERTTGIFQREADDFSTENPHKPPPPMASRLIPEPESKKKFPVQAIVALFAILLVGTGIGAMVGNESDSTSNSENSATIREYSALLEQASQAFATDVENAKSLLLEAQKHLPNEATAYINYAACLLVDSPEETVYYIEKTLQGGQGYSALEQRKLETFLGVAYARMGEFHDAVEHFEASAVNGDVDSAVAMYYQEALEKTQS